MMPHSPPFSNSVHSTVFAAVTPRKNVSVSEAAKRKAGLDHYWAIWYFNT